MYCGNSPLLCFIWLLNFSAPARVYQNAYKEVMQKTGVTTGDGELDSADWIGISA